MSRIRVSHRWRSGGSGINQAAQNIQKKLEAGVQNACLFAVAKMRENVNRGNANKKKPSLPGEFPKKVTGTLQNNIDFEIEVSGRKVIGKLGVRKSPASKYAKFLEYGTSKMAPRPFARPTVRQNQKEIQARIGKG